MEENEVQQKLKELQERGWTVRALADELGVHHITIHRWIAGSRYPENAKMVMMALDSVLAKKRVPSKRRYEDGHYLQRRRADSGDEGK